jgi:hypothetical protein
MARKRFDLSFTNKTENSTMSENTANDFDDSLNVEKLEVLRRQLAVRTAEIKQLKAEIERRTTKKRSKKIYFSEKVQFMPRLRNHPPYDDNEIVRWFAEIYGVQKPIAQQYFNEARSQLRTIKNLKKPRTYAFEFLIFDPVTLEWHGSAIE